MGLVHRSIMDRGQGGILRSNPRRRFRIERSRWHASGHTVVGGGARRCFAEGSPALLDLELWASVWDAARLYVELGGR
jgi:hypothetical protein